MQRLCPRQWTCSGLAAGNQEEPHVPVDRCGQPLCSRQQVAEAISLALFTSTTFIIRKESDFFYQYLKRE